MKKSVGVVTSVVVPSSVSIVTQRELIVIHEGENKSLVSYGGAWSYYLLRKIRDVSLVRDEVRGTVSMRLLLPGDTEQSYDYALDHEPEVKRLVHAVRSSRGEAHE